MTMREALPLKALLSAPADPTRQYAATVLPTRRAAEIPWDDASLIVWQAPVPKRRPMRSRGKCRASSPRAARSFSCRRRRRTTARSSASTGRGWAPTGQTADRRDGGATTPICWRIRATARRCRSATLEIVRRCGIAGEGVPLARARRARAAAHALDAGARRARLFSRHAHRRPAPPAWRAMAWCSSRALHRALAGRGADARQGAAALRRRRRRSAPIQPCGTPRSCSRDRPVGTSLALHAGVVASERQARRAEPPARRRRGRRRSPTTALNELFAGLDFRVLTDSLEAERSLTSEIWRTFLLAMAAALVAEALLCMPPQREIIRSPERASRNREPQPRMKAGSPIARLHADADLGHGLDRLRRRRRRARLHGVAAQRLALLDRAGWRRCACSSRSLIAITLNQPEWREVFEPESKPALVILTDASRSMETRDVLDPALPESRAEAPRGCHRAARRISPRGRS